LNIPKKCARKGAFWHISKFKFIPRKPAADAAFLIIDNSRLSTEANAPLFQHRMTGTTFGSSVDIGSVNLLRVHFHLMYTFFLLIYYRSKLRVALGIS
jgi:hypothetical protein